MGNRKSGFVYYSVDTDRFQDIRIKRLKKDMGCNGYAVYEYLLNEIYRVRGCFLVWDDSTAFDVAEYWGLKESTVIEIVNYCCSVGLFDKELLSSGGVLSSRSIQSRFIDMSKTAKRKEFKIPEEYNLIPEQLKILPEECGDNSGSLPQSKVKKSKVKESVNKADVEAIKGHNAILTHAFISLFDLEYPRINHLLEFPKCYDYYNSRSGNINNWESLYRNWLKKDFPKILKPVEPIPPKPKQQEDEFAPREVIQEEIRKAKEIINKSRVGELCQ